MALAAGGKPPFALARVKDAVAAAQIDRLLIKANQGRATDARYWPCVRTGQMSMATNNWIGSKTGTSNFWQDAANWSGGVPAISSDVAITAAGTYTVVITAADRPYQIKSLHLGDASGTIRLIEDGSLSVIGSANLTHSIFDIGAGATGSVFGNVNLDAGSTAMTEGVFNVGGAITGTGGTVEVDGGSLFAGAVSGSDHYVLSLDGAFEVGGGIAASSSITFADTGADTLVLDNAGNVLNATIAGFGGDNRLDIGSLPFSSQYTTHYSGTTLTISTGAGPVFTISRYQQSWFLLARGRWQ